MDADLQFPPSPYEPGVGAEPPVFAGRRDVLDTVNRIMVKTATYNTPAATGHLLVGVRGMGKTVALRRLRERAQDLGLVPVHTRFESGPKANNTQTIAAQLARAVAEQRGGRAISRRAGQHLQEFSVELNAGIVKVGTKLGRDEAPPGRLTDLLAAASEDLRQGADRPRGLALVLDELHTGSVDDLNAVAGVVQDIHENGQPVIVIGAGTPDTQLAFHKAGVSFSERFAVVTVNPLSREEAFDALVQPSTELGVWWSPEAIEAALDTAQGNPWRIQQLGDEAWKLADRMGQPIGRGSVIDLRLIEEAKQSVTIELEAGSFRSRWKSSSSSERSYLTAMAQAVDDQGIAQTRHVNALMSRTPQQNSDVRDKLLTKGLISSKKRGEIYFSAPGFHDFVLQAQEVERLDSDVLDALQASSDGRNRSALEYLRTGWDAIPVPDLQAENAPAMTAEEQRAFDRVQKTRAAAFPGNTAQRVAQGRAAGTQRRPTTRPAQGNDRTSAPDHGQDF